MSIESVSAPRRHTTNQKLAKNDLRIEKKFKQEKQQQRVLTSTKEHCNVWIIKEPLCSLCYVPVSFNN